MLTKLIIKDIVLIKDLDVNFYEGFTVLTGETGTGKSILIDSELRTEATINQKDMNDVAAILRGLGYVRDKNQTTNSITKERSRLWSLAQSTHS